MFLCLPVNQEFYRDLWATKFFCLTNGNKILVTTWHPHKTVDFGPCLTAGNIHYKKQLIINRLSDTSVDSTTL